MEILSLQLIATKVSYQQQGSWITGEIKMKCKSTSRATEPI